MYMSDPQALDHWSSHHYRNLLHIGLLSISTEQTHSAMGTMETQNLIHLIKKKKTKIHSISISLSF
jgi:hypothetical protein